MHPPGASPPRRDRSDPALRTAVRRQQRACTLPSEPYGVASPDSQRPPAASKLPETGTTRCPPVRGRPRSASAPLEGAAACCGQCTIPYPGPRSKSSKNEPLAGSLGFADAAHDAAKSRTVRSRKRRHTPALVAQPYGPREISGAQSRTRSVPPRPRADHNGSAASRGRIPFDLGRRRRL